MQNLNYAGSYRKDIDGLRAIAVLAVIVFHLGYLPNGYLGVDVFFVISGFLITKIIYREAAECKFSIARFYLRRTRRIIPLLLFVSLIALAIGCVVMLPDDLENLAQSVVATNLFSNNLLQYVTTKNYWDVVNEYKPLMHTWSLGIEEQFYLIYPLLFIFFKGKNIKWILPGLVVLAAASLIMYLTRYQQADFYLITYRFFELAAGGIAAIYLKERLIRSKITFIIIAFLLTLLFIDIGLPDKARLLLTVGASLYILCADNREDKIASFILENKLMRGIGLISFSLYMWHQLIFAFTRYCIVSEFKFIHSVLMCVLTGVLSILSYQFIEQPFRDKQRIKVPVLLSLVTVVFVLTTSVSLYFYMRGGVIRDVPELGITTDNIQRKMHSLYNDRIYKLDRKFASTDKIKVFVIGDSFGRDWANVLLESKYRDSIEISYAYDPATGQYMAERLKEADYIFAAQWPESLVKLVTDNNIDTTKIWIIGTKNFGVNNGIFYNKRGTTNYCSQRTRMEKNIEESNNVAKKVYGERYIDLIGMVADQAHTVPVFTPDCKFISQDCRHFTRSGAIYFARLLEQRGFKLTH